MRLTLVTILTLACASAAHAGGVVSVSFIEPSRFIDAKDRSGDATSSLKQIEEYLQYLGKRYLPDGQQLKIEITDVDLAGELRPSRSLTEQFREVRGRADWPRIDLRYSLVGPDGKELRSGQESLRDMDYTNQIPSYGANYEPMRYEKQLLEHWMKMRFTAPEAQ